MGDIVSKSDLINRAQEIRNETATLANTTERVGSFKEDFVETVILTSNLVPVAAVNTVVRFGARTLLQSGPTASTITIESLTGIADGAYGEIENYTANNLTLQLTNGVFNKTTTIVIPVNEVLRFRKIGSSRVSVLGTGPILSAVSELFNDANYQNDTQVAALITAAIAALVDASPGALDTLNELAAALGDDPNFATTITNLIANVQTNLTNHEADTSNPHNVTLDQVVAEDADTDVNGAELEELTDGSTTELHKHKTYIPVSGRFLLWSDGNWSCWSDLSFGINTESWDLPLGNGTTPTIDWRLLGVCLPAGANPKRIFLKCVSNNNDVDAIEVFAWAHLADLTQSNPIDSLAEIGAGALTPVLTFDLDAGAGNSNDMRSIDIDLTTIIDLTLTTPGDLHLAIRSTPGTLNANRNLRCTGFIEIEV